MSTKITATEVQSGDVIRYGDHTYTVTRAKAFDGGICLYTVGRGHGMDFYADSEVELLEREADLNVAPKVAKPFKVYTRRYLANGDCVKRIHSFATRAAQARFVSRTTAAVTFYN